MTAIQLHEHRTTGAYERLLGEAVCVLTDAARSTADFAEFVSHALAGAAANLGGIEALLTGRPGSWEAHHVRELLTATLGQDEEYLLAYRSEPLLVRVHVEDILYDLGIGVLYDEARDELARREDAITAGKVSDHDEQSALDGLDRQHDALDSQYRAECAAYGEAFAATVYRAAADLFPTLPVAVQVIIEPERQNNLGPDDWHGPAWRLWETARLHTPLPGSGIPSCDYPSGTDIAQAERATGCAPLARLGTHAGDPS